jgi:hypothetical protein
VKTYVGIRHDNGAIQVWQLDGQGGQLMEPLKSRYFVDWSDKVDWGNDSASTQQLAFAILLDHTGNLEAAEGLAIDFKYSEMVKLDHRLWSMTGDFIDQWLSTKPVFV